MKLCTFIQARDCARDIGYLLMMVSAFSDEIIILDHASKDDTHSVVKSYPKVRLVLRENNPNWDQVEMKNKQRLLDAALATGADWLFWIDADEFPDARMLYDLRKLPEKHPDISLFGFAEINLWNDEYHYRVDKGFYPAWTYRLFKTTKHMRYPEIEGIGHTMIPSGMAEGGTLLIDDLVIIHFGLMKSEVRAEKYNRYMELDKGDYKTKKSRYGRYLDETAELKEIQKEWIWGIS